MAFFLIKVERNDLNSVDAAHHIRYFGHVQEKRSLSFKNLAEFSSIGPDVSPVLEHWSGWLIPLSSVGIEVRISVI